MHIVPAGLWADGGEGWCMSSCCGSWVVCKWRFGMPAHFKTTRGEEKLFYWRTVILLQTILNWSTFVILIFTLYATIMTLYITIAVATQVSHNCKFINLKMWCYISHDVVSHSCNMLVLNWFSCSGIFGRLLNIHSAQKKKKKHSFIHSRGFYQRALIHPHWPFIVTHSAVYLSCLSVSVSLIHLMSHFWIKLASQSRSIPHLQLMDWMHDIWLSGLCHTCCIHEFAQCGVERVMGRLH